MRIASAHRIPTPSLRSVWALSYQRWLFAESDGGRMTRRQSLLKALSHSMRWASASVSRSCTEDPVVAESPPCLLGGGSRHHEEIAKDDARDVAALAGRHA